MVLKHLARLQALYDQGRLILAGPLPAIDSPDPGPAGFAGSLIVAEFASQTDAETWLAAWLLLRWSGPRVRFQRVGETLALAAVAVTNQGEIRTTLGGHVLLVGGSVGVRNEGLIEAWLFQTDGRFALKTLAKPQRGA